MPNLFQPRLAALQLLGQLLARLLRPVAGVLGGIGPLRFGQHLLDLGGNLLLGLLHPPPTHGLVLGGVGFHLRAVQRHPTQLHRPGFQRQPQHLLEQLVQRFQVDLAKVGNRAEVGLIAGRQHPKRHVLDQTLGDLARGTHPQAVAVEQQLHHQPRMVRRLAAPLLFIDLLDRRQIQLIDHVADEVDEVAFRQPIAQTSISFH